MNWQERLDASLERWNLLEHPFYQAWSDGTLPMDALQRYAREYGAFIAMLPEGWETLNDAETVEEEEEHLELWEDFASAIGTKVGTAEATEVQALLDTARTLFASPATAMGAMYAFEKQPPETAQSKLEGLQTHYDLPEAVEPYFVEHTKNHHEAEKLQKWIGEQPAEGQEAAVDACEQMSRALWDALTGVHQAPATN